MQAKNKTGTLYTGIIHALLPSIQMLWRQRVFTSGALGMDRCDPF